LEGAEAVWFPVKKATLEGAEAVWFPVKKTTLEGALACMNYFFQRSTSSEFFIFCEAHPETKMCAHSWGGGIIVCYNVH
jgi:hypothetical protein